MKQAKHKDGRVNCRICGGRVRVQSKFGTPDLCNNPDCHKKAIDAPNWNTDK